MFAIFYINGLIVSYPRQEHAKRARTRIRVSRILEMLEDDIDLRSLLRILVPAHFGDLPDQ